MKTKTVPHIHDKPGRGGKRGTAATAAPVAGGKPAVMHFTQMQHLIGQAEARRQTLDIKAWASDGRIVEYNGWYVYHQYWRGGYVRLRNPRSKQIRLVPEIFILEINGHTIYL